MSAPRPPRPHRRARFPPPADPDTSELTRGRKDQSCPRSFSRWTPPRSSPNRSSSATTGGTTPFPPQVQVKPGDSFRVHCREWFDGAIHNDDSADDVRDAPLSTVHVLSGPIGVEGAQPGDLLVVDILDVGPIPQEDSGPLAGQGWGYTGIFATENGGGFLTEQFPDAYKVIWDFTGGKATSRHVPRVSFTGIVHPGLMGTAPSAGAAGQVEQARGRPDRHRPEPGARRWRCRRCPRTRSSAPQRRGVRPTPPPRPPAPRLRGRTAATRTSRTSPRAPGSSTRSSSTARTCPWATCTSARATARSPSAAPSRWAGSSTCAST